MILLSAGHYPKSPGACYPETNPHWCEHGIAANWINRIAAILREQVEVAVVPTGRLSAKVTWINAVCSIRTVSLAVELHFNSDKSKRQKGSETLYCPGSVKGEMLATIVQGAVASIFPPNRGVKEGWKDQDVPGRVDYPGDVDGDESVLYFLKETNCPALIIEPEFIYNRSTIEASESIACEIISEALVEAVNA